MNTLFEKLKAIYEIEDLRNRLLITIGFLAVYRFGSFVILPGIDSKALEAAIGTSCLLYTSDAADE